MTDPGTPTPPAGPRPTGPAQPAPSAAAPSHGRRPLIHAGTADEPAPSGRGSARSASPAARRATGPLIALAVLLIAAAAIIVPQVLPKPAAPTGPAYAMLLLQNDTAGEVEILTIDATGEGLDLVPGALLPPFAQAPLRMTWSGPADADLVLTSLRYRDRSGPHATSTPHVIPPGEQMVLHLLPNGTSELRPTP